MKEKLVLPSKTYLDSVLHQHGHPLVQHEPDSKALPDETLATDMLPIVLVASFVIALGICGLLMVWEQTFRLVVYTLPCILVVNTLIAERRRSSGHIRQAGAIIAYTYGLIPLATIPLLGVSNNALIYMAPVGVALAALLVSADAAVVLARLYGLLLIGAVLLFSLSLADALLPVFAALLLLSSTTALSWMSAYSVQGTISWALEAGYKGERREHLLRETQFELERALRERDRLNDELQQLNYDLERARAAAEAAYRSKASFMATMSHELRTPLSLVIGFSTAMIEHPEMYDDEPLSELYRTDIIEIQHSGRHLLQLINDILDLAKVEAGRLELQTTALDLHPLLVDTLRSAAALIKDRQIRIVAEFPDQMPPVLADEIRVRQILLNLISNACKFTYAGEVALGARFDQRMVEVWVRDTGIGIERTDQERIFGEFEQVENHDAKQQSGTGLGLSICRWLVDLHNGDLRLESEPDKGSTFFFTLPRIDVQRPSVLASPRDGTIDMAV